MELMLEHHPRGPRRFSFTYDDLAAATGKPRRTVIQDASARTVGKRRHKPKFNPEDLVSLVHYVMRARLR